MNLQISCTVTAIVCIVTALVSTSWRMIIACNFYGHHLKLYHICWCFKVVTFLVLDENRWSLWAIKVAEMSSFLFKPCHKGYCPWIEVVQGFYDPFLPTYIDDSNRVKALINFVFLITHSSIRVLWFNLGKLNRKLQWSDGSEKWQKNTIGNTTQIRNKLHFGGSNSYWFRLESFLKKFWYF